MFNGNDPLGEYEFIICAIHQAQLEQEYMIGKSNK